MPDSASSHRFATPDPRTTTWSNSVSGTVTTHRGDTDPDRTGPHVPGAASPADLPGLPGYDVEGELGRGGMGVVYKARHVEAEPAGGPEDGPRAARADSKELIRFLAEAEAVAAVQHPHVVQVYEFGEADGRPYLALEFCPGGSLAERLKAGRLDPPARGRAGPEAGRRGGGGPRAGDRPPRPEAGQRPVRRRTASRR